MCLTISVRPLHPIYMTQAPDPAAPIPILFLSRQVQFLVGQLPDGFITLCLDDGGPAGDTTESLARLDWLTENGKGIRAIIAAGLETLDEDMIDALPDLELIALITAGYTEIDMAAAKARGIAVTNAGDINAGDVAEFAIALLLAHRREIVQNHQYMLDDGWMAARRFATRSLAEERVGIVGLGSIGKATAERLQPFGCEIAWWGPNPKSNVTWPYYDNLEALAEWATCLIICARGDEENRGTISKVVIEKLGPEGLLVNVSRGLLVDEEAMIEALKTHKLGGAALDVFDIEPWPGSTYADVPGLLMAPHQGGATRNSFVKTAALVRDNVACWFAGEPVACRVI